MKNKSHVITRNNIEQEGQQTVRSDVVIPNKLCNGETCKGLLRRFVHKITNNNEISPHNDMINKNVKTIVPQCPSALTPLKKKPAFTLAESATHVDLSPTKVKFAFTLAEVLITLGIIGVVAAITIPGLINNYKANKLRSQFLKSYSVIQQVFKQMEAADVSLDPSTYAGHSGSFYKEFRKFLNGSTDCGTWSKQTYPCADVNNLNYKTYDKSNKPSKNLFDDGQIALPDGTLIMFENPASTADVKYDYVWLFVDINGYDNPPNIWGYDLFTFEFQDGELRTMGDKNTKYHDMNQDCNPKSKSGRNGIACAQKAKTDTDYFKWVVKNIK